MPKLFNFQLMITPLCDELLTAMLPAEKASLSASLSPSRLLMKNTVSRHEQAALGSSNVRY